MKAVIEAAEVILLFQRSVSQKLLINFVLSGCVRTVVKKVDFSRNDQDNPPFAAPTVQDGSRPGIAPGNTELVPAQATPQA